jgi:hypothetical protein
VADGSYDAFLEPTLRSHPMNNIILKSISRCQWMLASISMIAKHVARDLNQGREIVAYSARTARRLVPRSSKINLLSLTKLAIADLECGEHDINALRVHTSVTACPRVALTKYHLVHCTCPLLGVK